MQFYTPILLTVSENYDNAWRVFEVIKIVRPPKLYIAVNHDSNDSHIKNFEAEIGRMSHNIDWPCEIKVFTENFNNPATASPLMWFFSMADEGIIIEDTCLPVPSFFAFSEAMLERYRAKKSVLTISGTNVARTWKSKHSYFFSQYGTAGGWATWKRAWESDKEELSALFVEKVRDWTKTELESLTIVPTSNLIERINESPRIPCTPLRFPLEHQITFRIETPYDKYLADKLSKNKLESAP